MFKNYVKEIADISRNALVISVHFTFAQKRFYDSLKKVDTLPTLRKLEVSCNLIKS